jgi:hypothetical protein
VSASKFSPEQFLNTQYTKSTDTRLIAVPAGEYNAQISKLVVRSGVGKEKDRTVLDVMWEVIDENAKQFTGLDHPQVRQSVFLDVTGEGALDFSRGKCVQLGRLRDAVNQNADGKPWSPSMLTGAMARIRVENRPDENDPETTYADVKAVTRIQ